MDNKNLVIKECEKGGACMIMDKQFYCEKMEKLLKDETTYKEIGENIDATVHRKTKALIDKHSFELTSKEIDYLTNFEYRTSNMYGLPKIHKSQEVKDKVKEHPVNCITITHPSDSTMRPIIAGHSSFTSKLSDFFDTLLRPYLKVGKSYIRDDIDILTKIPRETDEKKVHATFDITSMYTNINNDSGYEAIRLWLERHPELTPSNVSKNFILDALKLVLEFNMFHFNNKIYLQIGGTAIGTKCATLVMAYFELQLYQKMEQNFGRDTRNKFNKDLGRYLDDCFINWDTNISPIQEIHNILNNLHPRIKFTMEYDQKEMNFLDINLQVKGKNN